jgi:hypothetical protein
VRTYSNLYALVAHLHIAMSEGEDIQFSEAQRLLSEIQRMAPEHREQLQGILALGLHLPDMAAAKVWAWPDTIVLWLEGGGTEFQYRLVGEDWEVIQQSVSGNEVWVATVATAGIAETVTNLLNDAPGDGQPSII